VRLDTPMDDPIRVEDRLLAETVHEVHKP
jgi:hypothetical protein